MKKVLMAATLLLMSNVEAKWVDIGFLMGDNGKNVLRDGLYQRKGLNFRTELGDSKSENVNSLSITAYKFNGPFAQKELETLASEVFMYAQNCYNVSPDREKTLKDWIVNNKVDMRNTFSTQGPDDSVHIGPLDLTLTRWVSGNAYAVEVYVFRKGIPGSGAWKNYCIVSG